MSEKLSFEELYAKCQELRKGPSSLSEEIEMVEQAGWNWQEFNSQSLRFQFKDVKVNEVKLPFDVVALEYDRLTDGNLFRELMSSPNLDTKLMEKLIDTLENGATKVAEYLGACGWEYVEFMDERNKRAGVSFTEVKEKLDQVDTLLKKEFKIKPKTNGSLN